MNVLRKFGEDETVVFLLHGDCVQNIRRMAILLQELNIQNPILLSLYSYNASPQEHLINFSTDAGALLLDGFCDGLFLGYDWEQEMELINNTDRDYFSTKDVIKFTNNTAFNILQATRSRISKTEYISCPSCGRTLFDLQETTAKIREATHHLKGVKIAIMGCIVNGPGEMADADFGYVGSGPGKITLYKNKEVMKKNISSETAVEELIQLLKEHGAWVEKE
jgi:(E)-4-hydroxy-3-methylbut-2-enyl-diphosphate synthase